MYNYNPFEVKQDKHIPSFQEVKGIFSEAYTLYVKYYKQQDVDWQKLHDELLELEHKYQFDLAISMLTEIGCLIERERS